MIKTYKQISGDSMAVALEGDEIAVTQEYYSYYNHGATDAEFHWIGPNFGYFYTDEKSLKKALINKSLFRILNENPDKYKGFKKGALPEAKGRAVELYNLIEDSDFLPKRDFYNEQFNIALNLSEELVDTP